MGQGFKFKHGCFDAAISISALQWLCVASKKSHNPYKRLNKFFGSLYNSLKTGGRAVFFNFFLLFNLDKLGFTILS